MLYFDGTDWDAPIIYNDNFEEVDTLYVSENMWSFVVINKHIYVAENLSHNGAIENYLLQLHHCETEEQLIRKTKLSGLSELDDEMERIRYNDVDAEGRFWKKYNIIEWTSIRSTLTKEDIRRMEDELCQIIGVNLNNINELKWNDKHGMFEIIKKHINESCLFKKKNFLLENLLEDEWCNYDATYVLNEFIKNPTGPQSWAPLINPSMYQRALDEFSRFGHFEKFPSRYVYQWLGIIVKNTLILNANTALAGHDNYFPYDDVENSNLTQYLRDLNIGIIDVNYGYDTGYDTTILCTPQYLINEIRKKSRYLSPDETNLINTIEQKLDNGRLNEDAVHKTGPNKGQTTMFVSQAELDDYDYRQYIKHTNATAQTLVDLYNRIFAEIENGANFSTEGNNAHVLDDGTIEIKTQIFNLLDDIGLYDWMVMPDGSDAWSDYGIRPLFDILNNYDENTTAEEALVMVNKCLDVYHQRGDMSSIFIDGGTKTLSEISNRGYVNESWYGEDEPIYHYVQHDDDKFWIRVENMDD